jgi:magnesium-transporting ATPase (P-type)
LEVVRYAQGKLLERDQKCKNRELNAEVQTSSVNDDLGQIEFILSDKTGTLTKNQMDFKFLYVNGVSYGQNEFLRFDNLGNQNRLSK